MRHVLDGSPIGGHHRAEPVEGPLMKAPDGCCDAQPVEVYSPKKARQFSNLLTWMDSA